MFDLLRKMILPIIITVLVLFAGMIVLEWGMGLSGRGGGLDNPGNLAGVVNGESITYEDYSRVLNNLYEQERQNRGVDYEIPEERETPTGAKGLDRSGRRPHHQAGRREDENRRLRRRRVNYLKSQSADLPAPVH